MTDKTPTTRRRFLGGAAGLAAAGVTAARADNAKIFRRMLPVGRGSLERALAFVPTVRRPNTRRTLPAAPCPGLPPHPSYR